MAENLDSEHGSGSPTGGQSDESNGFVHVESANESVDSGQMGVSVNQEPDSQLPDHVDEDNGVVVTGGDAVQVELNDAKVADDGGKEEFVDCAEELNAFNDNREAIELSESEQKLGDDEVVTRSSVSDSGVLESDLEHQEATLFKTIGEGETSAQEYKEERSLSNELTNLRHQLQTKDQQIADLNAIINEHLLSHEVSSKTQLEKERDIEDAANRVLASLATVFRDEDSFDESLSGKISHVERSTSYLAEMYKYFLSEVELLSQCLTEVNPDLHVQAETDKIFLSARNELLEQKNKEVKLAYEISRLEDENKKLVNQVDESRVTVELLNAEIGKLKVELEQEKTRYGNTKEKLSMAVTKGKALVQQRDSLKQSLADKTSELEKCLLELQEKSSALEAAELRKEDLVRTQTLADSLQETLSLKDSILGKCDEILTLSGVTEELQSLDMIEKIAWLAKDRNALAIEVQKLVEALSTPGLPESMQSSNLESRISWLFESYSLAKDEATTLTEEIARTREAARNEIDQLTASLLVETQEKNYLHEVFEELTRNYEGVVEKERKALLEKEQMVEMLLVASGLAVEEQYDTAMVFEKCIEKIKEQTAASPESSSLEKKMFEKFQTLLYIRDQESMLYEKILEDEDLDKSEMQNRLNEFVMVSEELGALKEEKGSLQADLQRSEEKAALLREKLSMAVKKGKGLVQERENTKQLLGEKNALIETLKLELQQQESAISDCRNQIDKLSTDVEHIPQLETDLVAMKEQRDQLEQFLVESNSMLQRVIESIDGIIIPVDFEEPVQKVKWLAEYLSECQDAKTQVEHELKVVKDEANDLASKLVEVQKIIKLLEDALLVAERNFSQLTEEKRELQIAKTNIEEELQKAMEEATSHASKFAEACASRNSLEDALALAENEREDARASKVAAEVELQKVKEEVSVHTSKLDEAYHTIQSLEDALSQLRTNVSLLTEENGKAQVDKTFLEDEIKKLKEETDSQACKFVDASSTIKSLEDTISDLVGEKKNAEQEIHSLNSKLSACMQELVGKHDSRSLELSGFLDSLQLLLKDETLSTLLRLSFEKKVDSLKDMDQLLSNMRDTFVEMDSELLQNYPASEDKFSDLNIPPADIDNIVNIEMVDRKVNAGNAEGIIGKTVENFLLRNKILAEKFRNSSTFIDELLASLLKKLKATRDSVSVMLEHIKSMQKKANNLEMDRQSQENKSKILLSACTDAIQELNIEMDSALEQEGRDHSLSIDVRAVAEGGRDHSLSTDVRAVTEGTEYVKAAEGLLSAARYVQSLIKHLQNVKNTTSVTIGELQSQLEKTRLTCAKAEEEKDVTRIRVSELENALDASENLCKEMRFKLKEREVELMSLQSELEKTRLTCEKAEEGKDVNQISVTKLESALEASQNMCTEMRFKLEEREAELTSLQSQLQITRLTSEKAEEEKDISQIRVSKLENDLAASQNLCNEMRFKLEEREAELTTLQTTTLMKEHEAQNSLMSASQMKSLVNKINVIEVPLSKLEVGELEPQDSVHVKKLFYIIDSVKELQHQLSLLSREKEELQSSLLKQDREVENLKEEVEEHIKDKQDSEMMKNELFNLSEGLGDIIHKLGGSESVGDQKLADVAVGGLLPVLERLVMGAILECENSKSKAQDLEAKLMGTQKVVDELAGKVKVLEDSNQSRAASPRVIQERGAFEAPSSSARSEISEIEDVGPIGKAAIPPLPTAAHSRTLRKGSSDQLAIDIDLESNRLIDNEETNEDKGHVFKSLITSGIVPVQGRMIADRIDGIWVSGGRALMSRPRARLGLIAYWLVLHIWLLGTIL